MKNVFRAAHALELARHTQPAWCVDSAAEQLAIETGLASAAGHSAEAISATIAEAENAAMCVALGDAS